MTPEQQSELRAWMESRFDRIDEKVDHRFTDLAKEIQTTRHGFRPVMEQFAIQLAELVTITRQHDRDLQEINDWRSPEGPLDSRLKRHSVRQDTADTWRNRVIGGLIVLGALFPTTVGVIVAVLR